MDKEPKKTKAKPMIGVIVSVILALAIVAGAGYAIYRAMDNSKESSENKEAPKNNSTATENSLEGNVDTLEEQAAQEKAARDEAKRLLNDRNERVILSE